MVFISWEKWFFCNKKAPVPTNFFAGTRATIHSCGATRLGTKKYPLLTYEHMPSLVTEYLLRLAYLRFCARPQESIPFKNLRCLSTHGNSLLFLFESTLLPHRFIGYILRRKCIFVNTKKLFLRYSYHQPFNSQILWSYFTIILLYEKQRTQQILLYKTKL